MGRLAERLRRLENANDDVEDDAMRWVRRWDKRYGSKADGRNFLPEGCPDDDPVWLAYIESPQGKVDAAAAKRHEMRGPPLLITSSDELRAISAARLAGLSVPSSLPDAV